MNTDKTCNNVDTTSEDLEKLKQYALDLEALIPPWVSVKFDHNGKVYMERSGRGRDIRMSNQDALQIIATSRAIVEYMISV